MYVQKVSMICVSDGVSAEISNNICSNASSPSCVADVQYTSSNEGYYALFIIGQIMMGIGAVPASIIGVTYIDENSKTRDSAFLMGIR